MYIAVLPITLTNSPVPLHNYSYLFLELGQEAPEDFGQRAVNCHCLSKQKFWILCEIIKKANAERAVTNVQVYKNHTKVIHSIVGSIR